MVAVVLVLSAEIEEITGAALSTVDGAVVVPTLPPLPPLYIRTTGVEVALTIVLVALVVLASGPTAASEFAGPICASIF